VTTIRHGRAADAAEVVALWRDTADVLPSATDSVECVAAPLARDNDALLVAEDGDAIVGTLIVGWDGWRGNLYRLAVATSARRRGVATALVRAGEAQVVAAGCRRMTALVDTAEPHAAAFWLAAGFELRDGMDRYSKNV
jgi:ribosomal protein S18 acetylase RimI-like enzyme